MLITRKEAAGLTKEKLAEMAIRYANDFARKLGSDKQMKVKASQVFYDQQETLGFFSTSLIEKILDPSIKDIEKVKSVLLFEVLGTQIKEGIGFFNTNFEKPVLYTPLGEPDEDNCRRLFGKNPNEYLVLNHFGAEVGHFVGYTLYGGKVTGTTLSEVIDALSHLYEISVDIAKIGAPKVLEKQLANITIQELKEFVAFYDYFLLGGEEANAELAGLPFSENAISAIEKMKENYVNTYHYDGAKLFLEAYKAENNNLENVYGRIGKILAMSHVNTALDALKELGWSDEKLDKYKDVLVEDFAKRKLNLK